MGSDAYEQSFARRYPDAFGSGHFVSGLSSSNKRHFSCGVTMLMRYNREYDLLQGPCYLFISESPWSKNCRRVLPNSASSDGRARNAGVGIIETG